MSVSTRLRTIERINELLPQTQCRVCGYDGCRPYAEAILDGVAKINRCPPGGAGTIDALADLLGRESIALDPRLGPTRPPQVVVIDEAECIGCVKCIDACPVDAIVGARKQMHTVIADRCTGCELCIPPCPVDCIGVHALGPHRSHRNWPQPEARERASIAAQRFEARKKRLARRALEAEGATPAATPINTDGNDGDVRTAMRRYIDEAVRRTRQKRRVSRFDS